MIIPLILRLENSQLDFAVFEKVGYFDSFNKRETDCSNFGQISSSLTLAISKTKR